MVAKLYNSGKKDIIMFLITLLVIFESRALVSDYLLYILMIKSLKSIQLE